MVDKRHLLKKVVGGSLYSFTELFNEELKTDLKHVEEKQEQKVVPKKRFCFRGYKNRGGEDFEKTNWFLRIFFGK